MWQRSQVAIEGVLPMCLRITNFGSTFMEGESGTKPRENTSTEPTFNMRLTLVLTVFWQFRGDSAFRDFPRSLAGRR